jgi:hypothetical protein
MEQQGGDYSKPFILNLAHANKICPSDMPESQKGKGSPELPLTSEPSSQVSLKKEEIP